MKSSSKKKSDAPKASAQNNAKSRAGTLARKPGHADDIAYKINGLSLILDGHDSAPDLKSPPADEVTLAEMLADGNLPDETFTIEYGGDDEVPPPNDADYVKFQATDSLPEAFINAEIFDFDVNFNFDIPASQNSADDLAFPPTPLPPLPKSSVRSLAAAASTTLAQEHREALAFRLPLEPEAVAAAPRPETRRKAQPLPPPPPESKTETALLLMEEIAATPSSNGLKAVGGSLAQPDIFQNAKENSTGVQCMFCNHALSPDAKTCRNCAAPVHPKRMLHDWVHIYAKHDTVNPNLITCRFCRHMVYRRAHECPKCHNVLLKPVYTIAGSIMPSQVTPIKPLKLKSNRFLYFALIALALAIAALIISKALTQTPWPD